MFNASHPYDNDLIAALPEPARSRLMPHLEYIEMPAGKALCESGDRASHVYFPTTAIVSMLYIMEDGASAEIAVIGREGIVGVALLMGGGSSTNRAVVQSGGEGYRLKAGLIVDEFMQHGSVAQLLLRYVQALNTQTAQMAACNRHHSLDQQLSRWLLLSLDRLQSNEVLVTQEAIANNLGVRREGITGAAGRLQSAGVIRYKRGRIEVLDRDGLEQRSCECYEVVRSEYSRLLPTPRSVQRRVAPATVTPLFNHFGMIVEQSTPALRRTA